MTIIIQLVKINLPGSQHFALSDIGSSHKLFNLNDMNG